MDGGYGRMTASEVLQSQKDLNEMHQLCFQLGQTIRRLRELGVNVTIAPERKRWWRRMLRF